MKLDITPHRSNYVAPTFGGDDNAPMDPTLRHRLRRPMIVGALVILIFVIGLSVWASFIALGTGISAPAEITVESNRKTLRARDAGTVRQILVKEGQLVRADQPLLVFNDVQARATYDVLQSQYDELLAQKARFTAEGTGQSQIVFPPELTSRAADPRVATLMANQRFLFEQRNQLVESQMGVLNQRIEQAQNQIVGQQAQLDSAEEQRRLTAEELDGYKTLYEKGYAPKTLILRYERTMADLAGRKGQLMAEIGRLRQQMGESRMNMASLRSNRQSEAAEGLRDAEARLADVGPRLAAAKQSLDATVVRSPTEGYVFNLTQYTPGGVVGGGERLLDIVPSNAPMMVTAMIKPADIDNVKVGMRALVRFVGLNRRLNAPVPARVETLSADVVTKEESGVSFYRATLRIDPKDLNRLQEGVRLTPGMPAVVQIVSGDRTVMGFLISPITDTLRDAFRDE